jgi:4-hydroxy-3-methylbut-2-enyl diphosphate reductase
VTNIIVAQPHGFCFGINRAIALAQDTAKKYHQPIFFLGELVHNQHVVDWLEQSLNIKTVASIDDIPKNSVVIIRAHGAAPQIYNQLRCRGLTIVDASCPLVLKSHQTVRHLASNKKSIIFLCNKVDHDETVGVVGEAPKFITPVTLDNIYQHSISRPDQTVVVTQTTLSTTETKAAFRYLKNKYPDITILPHICQATTDRQQAIIKLAKKYKFVIIVGSPTSANSNSLRQVAELAGATAYIVDTAADLQPDWFNGVKNIVVSSGASTPETILNAVIDRLQILTHP